MKYAINILLLMFFFMFGKAQQKPTSFGQIDFEHSQIPSFPPNSVQLYRDTIENPFCTWQIGKPQKTIFTAAESLPNAIVTDTLHPYPTNDTSSFIISQVAWFGWRNHIHDAFLYASYMVNSDSLIDYGTIEVSIDNGQHWIDILATDTLYHFFNAVGSPKPVLTGNSDGWKWLGIDFSSFTDSFDIHLNQLILLKFSFISDSVQTYKDGLMYDDFYLEDYWESVATVRKSNERLKIYPNPASNKVYISDSRGNDNDTRKVTITDMMGRVYVNTIIQGQKMIDISGLSPGVYNCRVVNDRDIVELNGLLIKQL